MKFGLQLVIRRFISAITLGEGRKEEASLARVNSVVVFQTSLWSLAQWFSLSVMVEQDFFSGFEFKKKKKALINKDKAMKQKSPPGHTLSLGRVNKRLFCLDFQFSFLKFKLHPSHQSSPKASAGLLAHV